MGALFSAGERPQQGPPYSALSHGKTDKDDCERESIRLPPWSSPHDVAISGLTSPSLIVAQNARDGLPDRHRTCGEQTEVKSRALCFAFCRTDRHCLVTD
jgi:hypothetical protein